MTDIIAPLPFTLTNGTTADADQVRADLNQIRNDVNLQVPIAIAMAVAGVVGGGYRGAVVYPTLEQDIPNNTNTRLSFDANTIDTDNIHNNVVNNKRLVVPAGVTKVRLFAQVGVDVTMSGSSQLSWELEILKNSGTNIPTMIKQLEMTTNGLIIREQLVTSALVVAPGEYFEFNAWFYSLAFIGAATNKDHTWFEMQILG